MSNDIVKRVNSVPVISAEALAHVDRYAKGITLACFEMMGGVDRMHAWADQNPTDFYTKLLPKLMSRTSQLEVSGSVTIDDAITRLESQTVDADYEILEPEKEYDL